MNVYTYTYSNYYDPPAPVVEVTIQHARATTPPMRVEMLIDSGSDATMLPIHVLRAIKAVYVDTMQMRGVSGGSSLVNRYLVSLQIGSHKIPRVRAVASSQNGDALLGRDVLNHLIVTLNGLAATTEITE